LTFAAAVDSSADGKVYASGAELTAIPTQRAVILFDEGRETLLLQSRFHMEGATNREVTLGWVVPCPSEPDLGSMTSGEARTIFASLGSRAKPRSIRVSPYVFYGLLVIFSVGSTSTLLLCILSFAVPSLTRIRANRGRLAGCALAFLLLALGGAYMDGFFLLCLLLFGAPTAIVVALILVVLPGKFGLRASAGRLAAYGLLGFLFLVPPFNRVGAFAGVMMLVICLVSLAAPAMAATRRHRVSVTLHALLFLFVSTFSSSPAMRGLFSSLGAPGITVLHEEDVGIYHARVIQADDRSALIDWLNENGFTFQETDGPVLDRYVQSGWCFAVATVRPAEQSLLDPGKGAWIDPILLRFDVADATYPLALTSTIGSKTDVQIYLLSTRKMHCDRRLPIRYAGGSSGSAALNALHRPESNHDTQRETDLHYLCEFRGSLTPKQMQDDLVFHPADDDQPYRRMTFRW
jgi:hypothetical protein